MKLTEKQFTALEGWVDARLNREYASRRFSMGLPDAVRAEEEAREQAHKLLVEEECPSP